MQSESQACPECRTPLDGTISVPIISQLLSKYEATLNQHELKKRKEDADARAIDLIRIYDEAIAPAVAAIAAEDEPELIDLASPPDSPPPVAWFIDTVPNYAPESPEPYHIDFYPLGIPAWYLMDPREVNEEFRAEEAFIWQHRND